MFDWLNIVSQLNHNREPFIIVTIAKAIGSTPREQGAKMIVAKNGKYYGTIGGGRLEKLAQEEAEACLVGESYGFFRYPLCMRTFQCCGGSVELMMEYIAVQKRVTIFGAGHVAHALIPFLAALGYEIRVVDERENWIESIKEKNNNIEVILDSPSNWIHKIADDSTLNKHVAFSPQDWVLVMTHSHDLDFEIVSKLAPIPLHYFGLIGSDTKSKRFRQRLAAAGVSHLNIEKLVCPIGIPLGGKEPAEVAISICAQFVQLNQNRTAEKSLNIANEKPYNDTTPIELLLNSGANSQWQSDSQS